MVYDYPSTFCESFIINRSQIDFCRTSTSLLQEMMYENQEDEVKKCFFNINRCFKCHKSAIETTLKRCGACNRISYCSKAHQKQDWSDHKKFCKVLQMVEKNIPEENLDNKQMWFAHRCIFIERCQKEMQRQLEPHEVNMIAYPKRCEICRSKNANVICENCSCVNYCSEEHKVRDSGFHAEFCDGLKLSMDLELLQRSHIMFTWTLRTGILKLSEKIHDFIRSSINLDNINPDQRRVAEIEVSVDVSYPLSLVHGLNVLNFKVKDKLVVHMVGSTIQEMGNLKKWEILPHIYKQLKQVVIFFIGPEICEPFRKDLCISCSKILKFKYNNNVYHDFVKSAEYEKPDIVCTFNPGFYEHNDSAKACWLETLPLLFQDDAPLIYTCYCKLEAEYDTGIIRGINQNLVVKKMKNPFASLFPLRSLNMDTAVSFHNYYICLIFRDSSKN